MAMRWITIAAIAAAATLSSAPAVADCVDDWEDRTIKASGVIRDIGEGSAGWWIEVLLRTSDGCEIAEIYGQGRHPAQCRVGGRFDVTGRFEYDEDIEDHMYLWMDDALAIRATSITCR